MIVQLALLFRNLACGWAKFRGVPAIVPSMNKSSSCSRPAKCYQKNKGLVSKSGNCIEILNLFYQAVECRQIVISLWFSLHETYTRHLIPMIRAEAYCA